MKQAGQHKQSLPFFPLGIILFPGEKAPLRIFEPRYKQLISECREKPFIIGIPYIKDGRLTDMGCGVRLDESIEVSGDGEMLVVVEGVSVFRILEFRHKVPGKLYSGGDVKIIHKDMQSKNRGIISLAGDLEIVYKTGGENPGKVDLLEVAKKLSLSPSDKLHLLSLENRRDQEKFVRGLLEIEKSLRHQKLLLDERVQEN